VFLPGAIDPAVLRTITGALNVPVNVLPIPGRTLAQHGELGIRRVSTGSLPYRAAVHAALQAAAAVRDGVEPPPAIAYDALQAQLISHWES
jgi:2-methylisocitrate lyase-like PEP mutase family enzyme